MLQHFDVNVQHKNPAFLTDLLYTVNSKKFRYGAVLAVTGQDGTVFYLFVLSEFRGVKTNIDTKV